MSGLSLAAGLLGLMKQEWIFPLVFSPVPAKVACSVAGAASQPRFAHKYLNLSDFQSLLSSIWTLFPGHWAIGGILIYIRLKPSAQKWPLTILLPETCISPLLRDFCCYSLHIRSDGLDPKAGTQRHTLPALEPWPSLHWCSHLKLWHALWLSSASFPTGLQLKCWHTSKPGAKLRVCNSCHDLPLGPRENWVFKDGISSSKLFCLILFFVVILADFEESNLFRDVPTQPGTSAGFCEVLSTSFWLFMTIGKFTKACHKWGDNLIWKLNYSKEVNIPEWKQRRSSWKLRTVLDFLKEKM